MTKVNFSNVSDIKPVPDGEYQATFSEFSEIKMSKASNLPMTVLTFVLQDDEFQGRKMWQNMSLAPEALVFTKRTLMRLGADPDIINDPDGIDIEEVLSGLVGASCILLVTSQEYPKGSGQIRNQVKEVKADTGSMFGN